ncbi:MAG: hypothetical protein V7695_24085 [Sulfitobacter sp.]
MHEWQQCERRTAALGGDGNGSSGPEASNLIGCKHSQLLQRIRPVLSPIFPKQSAFKPLCAASICDKTVRGAMQVGSMLLKNLLE